MEQKDRISALLRPSERLVAAISAVLPQNAASQSTPNTLCLALVAHKDPLSGNEEGSLFYILLSKPDPDHADTLEMEIQRIFPIVEDFSISMSQSKRQTMDLRDEYPVSPLEQSRGGFILSIYPGGGGSSTTATEVLTYDVQSLRPFLDECRGLKPVPGEASQKDYGMGPTYSWIAPYVHREPLWSLSVVPQDLRISNRSLHSRLSSASPGSYGDETADVHLIMDEWLHHQTRQSTSQGKHHLSLRVGTFNVNGMFPSQDLSPWLHDITTPNRQEPINDLSSKRHPAPERSEFLGSQTPTTFNDSASTLAPVSNVDGADLIVLGFQEVDLSAEALLYASSTVREDAWTTAVFAALGEKATEYDKFASTQLVGMLMIVIAKKSVLPHLTYVHKSVVGSGLMGFMGNKGAVGIRLQYAPPFGKENDTIECAPTTLTFVNSHLAAFDDMVDRRNQDFHDICARLRFNIADSPVAPTLFVSLFECDAVFWLGDLNYRVDVPDSDIRTILAAPHWSKPVETLLRQDQLRCSMATQKAFETFHEHLVTHLPSYRFSPGVATDTLGYDIKRRPAWCDRILYMASPRTIVKQSSYQAHRQITQSDHLPVSARFDLELDCCYTADVASLARKLHRGLRGLDLAEEKTELALDTSSIDFGKVRHKTISSRVMKLLNPTKFARAFRFIPLEDTHDICPRWLDISPSAGIVLAGQDVEIVITINIDDDAARELNLKFWDLRSILVVHEMFGKDYFCLVEARYEPTCLGNSIQTLARLPGPIRSSQQLLPEDRALNAPREVMRLVHWLMTYCENKENLFVTEPNEALIDRIIECLDTGEDFNATEDDATAPIAMGEALRRLLDSSTEPLVPVSVQSRCITVQGRDEAFEMLDEFPPASVNVWISITAFLHYVCETSNDPGPRIETIASLFAPILMKDVSTSPASQQISPLAKYTFVRYFLA